MRPGGSGLAAVSDPAGAISTGSRRADFPLRRAGAGPRGRARRGRAARGSGRVGGGGFAALAVDWGRSGRAAPVSAAAAPLRAAPRRGERRPPPLEKSAKCPPHGRTMCEPQVCEVSGGRCTACVPVLRRVPLCRAAAGPRRVYEEWLVVGLRSRRDQFSGAIKSPQTVRIVRLLQRSGAFERRDTRHCSGLVACSRARLLGVARRNCSRSDSLGSRSGQRICGGMEWLPAGYFSVSIQIAVRRSALGFTTRFGSPAAPSVVGSSSLGSWPLLSSCRALHKAARSIAMIAPLAPSRCASVAEHLVFLSDSLFRGPARRI